MSKQLKAYLHIYNLLVSLRKAVYDIKRLSAIDFVRVETGAPTAEPQGPPGSRLQICYCHGTMLHSCTILHCMAPFCIHGTMLHCIDGTDAPHYMVLHQYCNAAGTKLPPCCSFQQNK